MLDGDLVTLTSQIRRRERSAREAVSAALATLDRFSHLSPVAWRDDPAVLARADTADVSTAAGDSLGELHGVPITVKDWIDVTGFPCAGGDPAEVDRRPDRDATAVSRLRAAGAIVVAKTAAGETSSVYGTARNPWDPGRTPGHSSSGDAIAVATRAVPLGIGSDSGGSLRFPAHCSGVAAIKPTYGLVPDTGHFPRIDRMTDGRTVIGPMARSVADLEVALRIIAGADGIDPDSPPLGLEPDRSAVHLRVVAHSDDVIPVDSEMGNLLDRAAAALSATGHDVTQGNVLLPDQALDITQRYWDRPLHSGEATEAFLADWQSFRRRAMTLMQSTDVILSPAAPYAAPPIGKSTDRDWTFTLAPSLWGFPALVVPMGTSIAGLPVGVQIVTGMWKDALALRIGRSLETTLDYP